MNNKRPLVVQYVFNKAIQQHRRQPPAIYKSNKNEMATYSITQEQLQSILDQHVEKLLGAGLIKKGKANKSMSKKSASASAAGGSDSASEAGSTRSVGEGTKAWNDLTKIVSSLVKEALAGEKGGAGFHFKVLSYLKNQKGLKTGESPTLEMVKEAVSFLKSNPEFKSPNQKSKEEKTASLPSEEGPAEAEVSAPAEKKKPGRPKGAVKSEEDKEAAKAAKKAEKEEAAAAKKAEKEAEKAAKKAEKKPEVKKAAPAPKKAPEPVEDDSEEEEMEMVPMEVDGQQLFWNESTGEAFENIEGALGECVGIFDGITLTPA